jgi:hypothetical protein
LITCGRSWDFLAGREPEWLAVSRELEIMLEVILRISCLLILLRSWRYDNGQASRYLATLCNFDGGSTVPEESIVIIVSKSIEETRRRGFLLEAAWAQVESGCRLKLGFQLGR